MSVVGGGVAGGGVSGGGVTGGGFAGGVAKVANSALYFGCLNFFFSTYFSKFAALPLVPEFFCAYFGNFAALPVVP